MSLKVVLQVFVHEEKQFRNASFSFDGIHHVALR